MKRIFAYLIAGIAISCVSNQNKAEELSKVYKEPTPIDLIELAHSKDSFLAHDFIQFDMILEFGGKERLNGRLTLATNSSKGRIDYSDGRQLLFDQSMVYADTRFKNPESARFAAYTWSYFFLFPYKLGDPGTNWSKTNQRELNGKMYNSAKLTFEDNIGDAPDDWYITYSDTSSHLIEVAAYIVTAGGTTVEEAEEDPHAISYSNYQNVNGIQFAHSWKFWEWRQDSGLTRQLGSAELSGFKFLDGKSAEFTIPKRLTKVKK